MSAQTNYFLQQAYSYIQANNFDAATLILKQCLRFSSNNIDVIRLLSVVEAQKGNYGAALNYADEFILISPRSSIAHSIKGNILSAIGRHEDAIVSFRNAIKHDPLNSEAYSNLGNLFQDLARYEEAVDCYEKAIQIQPDTHFFYINLGNALLNLRLFEGAVSAFDSAVILEARDHEAWSGKACALIELKKFDDALSAINTSLHLHSGNADALINKAVILIGLERYQDALDLLDKVNQSSPGIAVVWSNRGAALEGLALYKEAIASYEIASQLQPKLTNVDSNLQNARHSLACLNLREFRFSAGWAGYDARWESSGNSSTPMISKKQEWSGMAAIDPLYVWAEQGIGDQVLYGSMLKDLQSYPQKKIITVNKKLLPIFTRSFPDYQILEKGSQVLDDLYGGHIAMGSLGKFLRNKLSDFDGAITPYLIDDEDKTNLMRSDLKLLGGQIACGLSWRSSNSTVGDSKSIDLSEFLPVLKKQHIDFINLQYGDVSGEIGAVYKDYGVKVHEIPGINIFDDIDSLLSLIKACDIIITTSNTTAHLAGAIGQETLLILPYSTGKFWYWHDIDQVSLWYPSIKIFKQEKQGDWSKPIQAAKSYLESRFAI